MMRVQKYMVDIALGVLVLIAAVYILALLSQTVLAMFLGAIGITTLGGSLLASRQQFLKYRMQLEIFYYVIWFASALIIVSIIQHALEKLNYPLVLGPMWDSLVSAAAGLELPILIFSVLYFSFRPGKPDYYAFLAFLIVVDQILSKSLAEMLNWATALALISFGVYLILGKYAGWKLVTQICSLAVAITAINAGLDALHNAGVLTWLVLPEWWSALVFLSSGLMLGSVMILFIIYIITNTGIKTLLVATAVYVLTAQVFSGGLLEPFTTLIYLAVFSIAVWVLLGLAGG